MDRCYNVGMNPIVRTILPLLTWTWQKALGPVCKPSEWRAIALSLLPPPNSIVNVIMRECTTLDSAALLSASARRRFRNNAKRHIEGQLRGNPKASKMCSYLLSRRQKLESEGYTSDISRIRKEYDIESETNAYYTQLAQNQDIMETFEVDQDEGYDINSLLWEFALYGEGGSRKPQLRRNSVPYKVLNIDPEQLNSLPEEDVPTLLLSRFQTLIGMDGNPPDENKLWRLLNWVLKTHLPADLEPRTTPKAMKNAVDRGLIHRGHEVKGKETDEVELEIEDSNATRFTHDIEVKDELDRIVSRTKLSTSERCVFNGMQEGLKGKALFEWLKDYKIPITASSVNVLVSRVKAKLKAAAKN